MSFGFKSILLLIIFSSFAFAGSAIRCLGFYDENLALDQAARHIFEYKKATLGKRTSYHGMSLKIFREADFEAKKTLASNDEYSGYNHSNIFEAYLNGRKVFIKYTGLNRPHYGGLNEASYAKLMSDLGLGPTFHGVYAAPDGKIVGYITDFIEGTELKHNNMTEKLSTGSAMVARLLARSGINVEADLQYRRDVNGRFWVVDTNFSPTTYFFSREKFMEAYRWVFRLDKKFKN